MVITYFLHENQFPSCKMLPVNIGSNEDQNLPKLQHCVDSIQFMILQIIQFCVYLTDLILPKTYFFIQNNGKMIIMIIKTLQSKNYGQIKRSHKPYSSWISTGHYRNASNQESYFDRLICIFKAKKLISERNRRCCFLFFLLQHQPMQVLWPKPSVNKHRSNGYNITP